MIGKIYRVVYVLAFIFVVGLLIYALFLTEEKDYRLIGKAAALVATYVFASLRAKKKYAPSNSKIYETQYKDVVEGAFGEDKKSYKKLLKVARFYNQDQYHKAHKLLDELEKKCGRTKDYSAVYMFRALCYTDEKKTQQAIIAYEKLLQYDVANSRAWSNLGLRYLEMDRMKEAEEAYLKAIRYNPANAYAYCNLSDIYIKKEEAKPALENALRALELDSTMSYAMLVASVAYRMLGDEENYTKYSKMFLATQKLKKA